MEPTKIHQRIHHANIIYCLIEYTDKSTYNTELIWKKFARESDLQNFIQSKNSVEQLGVPPQCLNQQESEEIVLLNFDYI